MKGGDWIYERGRMTRHAPSYFEHMGATVPKSSAAWRFYMYRNTIIGIYPGPKAQCWINRIQFHTGAHMAFDLREPFNLWSSHR